MAILLPLLIFYSLDFPINVDEPLHYEHAKDVVDWYQTRGENTACLETPWTNLKFYGQSVDNLTALINHTFSIDDEYMVRHITGAVFAWLFVLFTGLLAFEITGRYRTAILAGIALLLIPSVVGQFYNNLKDIPFGAGYVFSIWTLIRIVKRLPQVPWKLIVLLALSIAFLISVRVGGLIIYPYLILFAGTWILLKNQLQLFFIKNRKTLLRLFVQFAVVLSGGYLLGLLFWPYGLIRPFSNPLESLSVMEDYSILIRQIFEGNWYWSKSLPYYYLPKWFLINLPEFMLVGLMLYGLHFIVNYKKISYAELIVLFTLIFPLAYVILIRSNLYSGWRQMYFVAGHIAVIFAIGSESMVAFFRDKKVVAMFIAALLLFTSLLPMIHYLRNPGTAYIYFNAIAGGNKQAWGNYEYDYYWHGMKEAALWFDENIQEDDAPVHVVSNFNVSLYLKHRTDIDVRYIHYDNRSKVPWEYGIFGINYIHPDRLENNHWKPAGIVKTIKDGYNNPLAVIVKRDNENDLEGIRSARLGNCNRAIELLNESIENDPNNFVLFEYLGECYYNSGDTLITRKFIEEAKYLHPWSEKINMIDAQLEYDRGNYEIALKKCLNIAETNNKYYNIVPLLISCYEKTGNFKMADFYRAKLLDLKANKNGN